MVDPWPSGEEIEDLFGQIQPTVVHVPNPKIAIYQARKFLKKIIPSRLAKKRFLDISCQQGYAVMAAKSLGFDAKGIDPHAFFISFAQSKYPPELFKHTTVIEYATRGEKADIIVARESFCEQTDLKAYVASISKILNPNGILYIEESDGNSIFVPRHFPNWAFVDPPLNFVYPSKKRPAILTGV